MIWDVRLEGFLNLFSQPQLLLFLLLFMLTEMLFLKLICFIDLWVKHYPQKHQMESTLFGKKRKKRWLGRRREWTGLSFFLIFNYEQIDSLVHSLVPRVIPTASCFFFFNEADRGSESIACAPYRRRCSGNQDQNKVTLKRGTEPFCPQSSVTSKMSLELEKRHRQVC